MFDRIELESSADALAGENLVKQRYADRLVRPRSEIFRFTPQKMREVMAVVREFVEQQLPLQRAAETAAAELNDLTPTPEVLPATEELKRTNERLRELYLDTARLDNQIKDVDAEIARLEATVKIAIGSASGIEGIATWTMGQITGEVQP
ncbi:hypothetical protein [Nocardia sp. NPDC004750]